MRFGINAFGENRVRQFDDSPVVPERAVLRRFAAILLSWLILLPPAPLAARTRKGEKLRNDARAQENRGNFDEALRLAEQAMDADPDDPAYRLEVYRIRFEDAAMHLKNGQKLRTAGKLDEALVEFRKAYGVDPSSDIAAQEIQRTQE